MNDQTIGPNGPTDYQALLLAVRRLTEQMQSLAESGDWQGLKAHEDLRRGILSTLFAGPVPAPLVSMVRNCLSDVLSANRTMIAKCHEARQGVGAQLEVLGQGRKAQRAYSSLD